LDKKPNVFVVRGNCEWGRNDFMNDEQWAWVAGLPIIFESEDFVFVHAGLENKPLDEQDFRYCLTTYAFLEEYDGPPFEKWVMVGHWPTDNLQHEVPCHNPIVCEKKRIICIDGGNVLCSAGQINAFIVRDGEFSWEYADKLPLVKVKQRQEGRRGTLSITWSDRFVEILEQDIGFGGEFSRVRHESGKVLEVPTAKIWQDDKGRACCCDPATDHLLSVEKGDEVGVVAEYSDRIFAKKNGEAGWIIKN